MIAFLRSAAVRAMGGPTEQNPEVERAEQALRRSGQKAIIAALTGGLSGPQLAALAAVFGEDGEDSSKHWLLGIGRWIACGGASVNEATHAYAIAIGDLHYAKTSERLIAEKSRFLWLAMAARARRSRAVLDMLAVATRMMLLILAADAAFLARLRARMLADRDGSALTYEYLCSEGWAYPSLLQVGDASPEEYDLLTTVATMLGNGPLDKPGCQCEACVSWRSKSSSEKPST